MHRKRRLISILVAVLVLAGIGFGLKALVGTAIDWLREAKTAASGDGEADGTGGLLGSGGLLDPSGTLESLAPLTEEEDILDFLVRMDPSEHRRVADQLDALTVRKDVMGYYANLYQAAVRETETGAAVQSDGSGDAVTSYRAALALYTSADIRFKLAQALERQGDNAGALVEYTTLLPDEKAYEKLLLLQTDPVKIGDVLIKKGMYTKAQEYAEMELAQTTDPLIQAKLSACKAVAIAASGDYTTAKTLFEGLPDAIRPDGKALAEGAGDAAVAGSITGSAIGLSFAHPVSLTWWYARSLEGTGDADKAMGLYEKLGAAGGERLGALLEKGEKVAEAAAAFLSAPASLSKWQGAKLSERIGKTAPALEAYLELASREDRLRDDAAYRAMVLLKRQGKQDSDAAVKCLSVLQAFPSWQERLGRDIVWPSVVPGTPTRPDWLDRMEQFEGMGRSELARIQLAIGTKLASAAEKLYLAQWYLDKNDRYTSAVWGMRALLEEKSVLAYRYAYPRAFEQEVTAFAEEFNVDPLLIWAVMRTESTYRADVLSRSGAIGLMQIMPATGQDIAGRLKVSVTDEDLKKPEVNVRFGAYYIGAMIRQFEGDWDRAMAAYNGGQGNVRKWSRDAFVKKQEDFPTVIPYEETREYITKVMDAYHHYKWMETFGVAGE